MKKKICGIYKITSITGVIYIGRSVDIENRWKDYKIYLAKGQPRLHNSLKSHGPENHTFEILEECSRELLNEREIHWIQHFDTFNTPHGMNLRSGGDQALFSEESIKRMSEAQKGNTNVRGYKFTEEQLKYQSEAVKGNKNASGSRTEEFKKKMSDINTGKKRAPFTEVHLKNMREAQIGKKRSEETCKKLSEAGKRREPPSEEIRRKNSEANKGNKRGLGYKHTEEWKRGQSKRSKGNKYASGQKRTEETKKSQSDKMVGRKQSPEHIAKRVKTMKEKQELKQHMIQSILFRQNYFNSFLQIQKQNNDNITKNTNT